MQQHLTAVPLIVNVYAGPSLTAKQLKTDSTESIQPSSSALGWLEPTIVMVKRFNFCLPSINRDCS